MVQIIKLKEYEETTDPIIITTRELEILQNDFQDYIRITTTPLPDPQDKNKAHLTLKARFYVGILGVSPDLTIIINPKAEADFIAMLRYIESRKITIWNKLASNIAKEKNFFNFFIGIFLQETHELLRKKKRQAYGLQRLKSTYPKGKILVSKSIQSRNIFPRKFYCRKFEFSFNNVYNQAIKHALLYIRSIISGDQLNLYKKIMGLLTDVDVSGFNIRVLQKITYNRLTYDYRPIHDYCWLILNDFSVKFEEGREKFFAFILNSWNVYEIFLATVFKRFQSKFQINTYRIDSVVAKINWDVKRDRPDIILSQSGEEKFIIEAKYKTKFQNIDRNQINWYLTQGRKKIPYG
ncbi:MAG: hypothetical protein ACFFC7_20585, partial [Candidatus Hermodarchaeota archaeon]